MEKNISIRRSELRTTVFKRALENNYVLKTQKARQFLAEVRRMRRTLQAAKNAFSERKMHFPFRNICYNLEGSFSFVSKPIFCE